MKEPPNQREKMRELQKEFDQFTPVLDENSSSHNFHNPYLSINWNLGNVCTYKCSYCPKECHDGSFPWPKIEEAIKTVKTIDRIYKAPPYNKEKIFFELLGGEVTLWTKLESLLSTIKETNNSVFLVTNGVRSLNWWKKNAHHFEHVTLSYHPEFCDYKHFCEVSKILHDSDVITTILILMYPKLWDKCVEAFEYFKKHSPVRLCLQKLHVCEGSKEAETIKTTHGEFGEHPYSEEQVLYMSQNHNYQPPITNKEIKKNTPFTLGFLSSQNQEKSLKVQSALLQINKLNNWKGWDCYIGIDSLYLEQNGDIRRSVMCRATPPLGKWTARKTDFGEWKETLDSVQWPTKPVVCPYEQCFCGADYRARRQQRNITAKAYHTFLKSVFLKLIRRQRRNITTKA